MWEKRYNALQPSRTLGNTRYYDGLQLKRLLNIVALAEGETQVGKICSLSNDELAGKMLEKFSKPQETHSDATNFIMQLIAAGINYDAEAFTKIYELAATRFDFITLYKMVVLPFLSRLGILWAGDQMPASQEHFMTQLIFRKMQVAIDALPPVKSAKETWVLCLPENEFHEIGLLFSHYLLTEAGKRSIYLGGNLPFDSLKATVDEINPTHILVFFVHYDAPERAQEYTNSLIHNNKTCKLFVAGNNKLIEQLTLGNKAEWIKSVDDLKSKL